jgi:RNA polymerase sigma factor (sigma-70 family)
MHCHERSLFYVPSEPQTAQRQPSARRVDRRRRTVATQVPSGGQKANMPGVSPAMLGELVDRHAAALMLFARQFCRSPEDVVQEAFVQLARQSAAPDETAAWLFRVVRNGALSAARAEYRRSKHEAAAAATRTSVWFVPTEADRLDALSAAEALAELPLDEREAVIAHLWGGLTFRQIGELAGISAATAFRRYEAALCTLRSRLEKTSNV